MQYAVNIVRSTRKWPGIAIGSGPRGGIVWFGPPVPVRLCAIVLPCHRKWSWKGCTAIQFCRISGQSSGTEKLVSFIMFKLIRQIFYGCFYLSEARPQPFYADDMSGFAGCANGVLSGAGGQYGLLWSAILLVVVLWDASSLYTVNQLEIETWCAWKMSLGLWHDVQLTIHYRAGRMGSQQLVIEVFDHYPVHCELRHFTCKAEVVSGQWAKNWLSDHTAAARQWSIQISAVFSPFTLALMV